MIWEQWLTRVQPRVKYTKFQHFEYTEQVEQRPQVEQSLVRLVHYYHTRSRAATSFLTMLGYPLTSQSMTGDQRPLSPEVRRGHLAEILACEFAREQLGYELPVHRLRYNPNPDQSMKGDDILGFLFAKTHQESQGVLIGEAKYRSTYSSAVVLEAFESLHHGFRPYPVSVDFVATILDIEGNHVRASQVRQIKNSLSALNTRVVRSSLLFLVTEGTPRNPFACIEDRSGVPPNLIAVNISLKEQAGQWIDRIYGQEPMP